MIKYFTFQRFKSIFHLIFQFVFNFYSANKSPPLSNFDGKFSIRKNRGINTRCVHLHLFFCTFFNTLLVPLPGQENSSNYVPANSSRKRRPGESRQRKEGRIGWRAKKKEKRGKKSCGGRDRYKSVSLIFHATAMESLFLPRKRGLIYM